MIIPATERTTMVEATLIMEKIQIENPFEAIIELARQHDGCAEQFGDQLRRADRLAHEIGELRGICLSVARALASCGSDDHKGKNEAILRAVARLLHAESAYSPGGSGADEIPF